MLKIIDRLNLDSPNKIIFAGDSITHGALHTYGMRYYEQLFSERLRCELERHRDFVIKTAITGWTTKQIKDDLDWNILQFQPDIVFLMMGTNDAKEGKEGIMSFKENYNYILDEIMRSGSLIVLQTMNPIWESAKDILGELELYAQAICDIALDRNLPVIDHYSHWEKMFGEDPNRIVGWMNDQTHPGERGHRAFARLIFKRLKMWDIENSRVCKHCMV